MNPTEKKKVHKMPLKMASFDKKIAIAGIFLEKEKIWRESGITTKIVCRYTYTSNINNKRAL